MKLESFDTLNDPADSADAAKRQRLIRVPLAAKYQHTVLVVNSVHKL